MTHEPRRFVRDFSLRRQALMWTEKSTASGDPFCGERCDFCRTTFENSGCPIELTDDPEAQMAIYDWLLEYGFIVSVEKP